MSAIFVFIAIQMLLMMVFVPIKFGVKVYFSLLREQMLVVFAIGRIKAIKLKICKLDDSFALFVNGRKKRICLNKSTPKKANVAIAYAKAQRMFRLFKFTLYTGAREASQSAMLCGVIKSMCTATKLKGEVYTDFERERCDFVVIARARVNLYEAVEIWLQTKFS